MFTVGEFILILWGSLIILPPVINIVAFTDWKKWRK